MEHTVARRMVEVVSYDSVWGEMFSKEEINLRQALDKEILEVHHIGSTAIPGMCAKPTIDMLVVVRDIEDFDDYTESMSAIGYEAKGEYGIRGRRFFTKGGNRRTHHVHAFQRGSPEIARHLLFRDFMIAHPSEAEMYSNLKRDLAARFESDVESYCQGKDAFIRDIDAKAEDWARSGTGRSA